MDDNGSTKLAIVRTDAGQAYLKAIGNPHGTDALAREWIGTSLAQWLGLRTFDFSTIRIRRGEQVDLGGGLTAEPGTAFVTRGEKGQSWSGKERDLAGIANTKDITRLVVLDTWLLNPDRCPPDGLGRRVNLDNVFFSFEGSTNGTPSLVAMDFSDCFGISADLTANIGQQRNIQDERIYGMFPQFIPFLCPNVLRSATSRLESASRGEMQKIVCQLPRDWNIAPNVQTEIVNLLVSRAAFLVKKIESLLVPYLGKQAPMPEYPDQNDTV